jgi:hypothetical protein
LHALAELARHLDLAPTLLSLSEQEQFDWQMLEPSFAESARASLERHGHLGQTSEDLIEDSWPRSRRGSLGSLPTASRNRRLIQKSAGRR